MVRCGPAYDYYGEEIDPSDIERDERTQGVCSSCGEECTAVTEDHGIGVYEYGSERARDVRLSEVSPCCEGEVITQEVYDEKVLETGEDRP